MSLSAQSVCVLFSLTCSPLSCPSERPSHPRTDRLAETTTKLEFVSKTADEAERQVKVLSNSSENDGDRVATLERGLKAAKVRWLFSCCASPSPPSCPSHMCTGIPSRDRASLRGGCAQAAGD